MDLYSIGEMVIDFIPGKEKDSYIRRAGGAPTNVAIAVSKNGLSVGMCCSVGNDDFGRFLQATLAEYQVKIIKTELCDEATTTMAFVSLDETGDRLFTFARKPGADIFIREKDVKAEDIKETTFVHAGSFSLSASPSKEATIKALKLGQELGKLVSFDLNYRNIAWKDDIKACASAVHECLPYIDFLKISEEEEVLLDIDNGDYHEFMRRNDLTILVKTLGPSGAECYFSGQKISVPGENVRVVDTTGAGDAFWGAFLSYLIINGVTNKENLNLNLLKEALLYANVSGSICVQKKGAIVAIPTRTEIEEYLDEKMHAN